MKIIDDPPNPKMPNNPVTSADVASCPKHILAPQHWIPVHHVEECHPDLAKRARDKQAELRMKQRIFSQILNDEYRDFVDSLRKEAGGNGT